MINQFCGYDELNRSDSLSGELDLFDTYMNDMSLQDGHKRNYKNQECLLKKTYSRTRK